MSAASAGARKLAALVTTDGLDRAELLRHARERFPRQPEALLSQFVEEAVTAGLLVAEFGRLRRAGGEQKASVHELPRVLRAVAVDVESVVRTTDREPYTSRRIFQIGAVRMGADADWSAASRFTRWLELPRGEDWPILSEEMRVRHAAAAVPAAEALSDLLAYLDGADVIVAYNGTDADFPMLAEALSRENLPALPGTQVDAYYLALALWPGAPSHRLAKLAEDRDVDRAGLTWHDAVDDAELLSRILQAGASVLKEWPADLSDLVGAVCPDSMAWRLLWELADSGVPYGRGQIRHHADVAELLGRLLADHQPRRGPTLSPVPDTLSVPASLRGKDGRVDPAALAALSRGATVARRPAQDQMTEVLHTWVDEGVGGAVEAPTGTGKSFAVIAAALDWLAADPTRTAIITTFTKQLQAQLAHDLGTLDAEIPRLLGLTDVVKGKANRLSLRALLMAVADATAHRPVPARLGFRELLIYLLLRLLNIGALPSWATRSVDPADLPPFFAEYLGPALPVWLAALSQAECGDYALDPDKAISLHTNAVPEAISSRRLILANHALLLAHLEHLELLGEDSLLIIDEAHELENTATSALTATLHYQAIEDLHTELRTWSRDAAHDRAGQAAREAISGLGRLLDQESLPRVVSLAFDARSSGTAAGTRTVTLAAPFGGVSGLGPVRTLQGLLSRLAGICEAVVGAMSAYRADHPLDYYGAERVSALISRTATARSTALRIVADLELVLGSVPALPFDEEEADSLTEADVEPLEGTGNGDRVASGEWGTLPPGTPNRVVHAKEEGLPRAGLRNYRFSLATSPIELAEDADWSRFLTAFRRTYLVSATLRVAGEWRFLRSRLGLPRTLRTLDLASPFDLTQQMRLVCLADFPSWAEQSDGAIRTVAHQLAGYVAEMVHPAGEERGGHHGGALVLTTARSTAGGIADRLVTALRSAGNPTPVLSALVLGNRQGVERFTDPSYGGGVLVGTKGLWQGVDIADPDRLRLVWINKLPFAPFADPVIQARRAAVAVRAESLGADDPEAAATETYYLPLAALQLRQSVGRLIRSERHRGVVVISDRKLAGASALRRTYRRVFLGSLEPELLRGEHGAGNVEVMTDAWRGIWHFLASHGFISPGRADELCVDEALDKHTTLPQTRAIRLLELGHEEAERLRAGGGLADEVVRRSATIAGLLRLQDGPMELKPAQEKVMRAAAEGRNVLGLLPTGYGKSYCFQLPALVLPGVTLVVSPLIALMHDQALELNRSIGGAVRALIGPMRESNSRAGRTEVSDQLLQRSDHRIKIIYVSPERLCQRRFRELVRSAVRDGVITRIAVDEAHTAIQWGDDFRPSFRRVERFLAELRADYGLAVTALTATANHAVRAGLRERMFGLGPGEPDGDLVTVQENPIRPELAIYRRVIATAGPSKVAKLIEAVVRELDGHAIFYCLTVKEVVALHAHLRDHMGEGRVHVRRFHGRLTEAEKAAVMTEFREAPARGEDGFVPLLVVATSAFGLGVDRKDVRTVFCVSPPTDLAALYQQMGRAGRDSATPSQEGVVNAGLALATNRSMRTVQFMTDREVSALLLRRMASAVLGARNHVLDPPGLADRLIAEDLAAGRIDPDTARAGSTHDRYVEAVTRVFATLADLGAVEDLGDFPPRVSLGPGELVDPSSDLNEVEERLITAVLELPPRRGDLHRSALSVAALDHHLAEQIDGYRAMVEGPAETWQLLADLHDRGRLDVSAAPSRHFVTGVRPRSARLPDGFHDALSGRAARAAAELERLRDFFDDVGTCANRKFADYFGVDLLPESCCSGPENRCSACWDRQLDIPRGEHRPGVGHALDAPVRLDHDDSGAGARLLGRQISALLWHVSRGLNTDHLHLALRGEDSWFHAGARRRVPLPRTITTSRYFGAAPTVTRAMVGRILAQLEEEGTVLFDGGRWRDTGNVRREAARRTREAR